MKGKHVSPSAPIVCASALKEICRAQDLLIEASRYSTIQRMLRLSKTRLTEEPWSYCFVVLQPSMVKGLALEGLTRDALPIMQSPPTILTTAESDCM